MFNALSAIQAEVLSNNSKVANNYLTKFGQLLQNVLTSTTQEYISINVEYKNLVNYIQLQEIRFKNFTYKLDVFEGIEDDEDLIPPMLLQPLVENAIEHGLKGLDYNGVLVLTIKKFGDYLACEITDNGNGLRIDFNKSKPSLSTSLIKQRLQFLSKEFNIDCDLNISNNLTGNGVVSKIKIPYKSRF
jgi:LytS/YehU family sensor histidine kinase